MISDVKALPPGELTRRTMALMFLSFRALRTVCASSGPIVVAVWDMPISPEAYMTAILSFIISLFILGTAAFYNRLN